MKTKPKSPKTAPEIISHGRVTIYSTRNRIYRKDPTTGEKLLKSEHPQFTLVYYSGARRIKRKFSDIGLARAAADLVVTRLANGDTEALKLTGADSARYTSAMETLRKWKPDADLGLAVADYVAAAKMLPEGLTLRECAAFWLKRHPQNVLNKTVPEVVAELIKSKTDSGKSDVYIKDLKGRLNAFASDFQGPIASVTGPEVETWLRGRTRAAKTEGNKAERSSRRVTLAPKSQNNYLRLINTMFQFAIKRGYLPKDHDDLDGVEQMEDRGGAIEVFTPGEMRTLFAKARPELKRYLAIAAFAGLRAAEIGRLDWAQVNLQERFIEVTASNAKTASRRLAPVPDNLLTWLAPYHQTSGPVVPFANMSKQLLWLADEITEALKAEAQNAGRDPSNVSFAWKHNGLRHSFISYRAATLKDIAAVALEAGNSPGTIFRHYRQLVTEAQGKEWFGIMPPWAAQNILTMPAPGVDVST